MCFHVRELRRLISQASACQFLWSIFAVVHPEQMVLSAVIVDLVVISRPRSSQRHSFQSLHLPQDISVCMIRADNHKDYR